MAELWTANTYKYVFLKAVHKFEKLIPLYQLRE